MNNLIVIEDDANLCKLIKMVFETYDFRVLCFDSAECFLNNKAIYDECIYIVDAGLPGLQGEDVVKAIRYRDKISPVFLMSGDNNKEKIMAGLSYGADDYLTKPFDPDMLVTKVMNANRKSSLLFEKIRDASIKKSPQTYSLIRDGRTVKLTITEYRIICLLLGSANKKKSRQELVTETNKPELSIRTIDVHVHSMRSKVESIGIYIESIRGYGYQVVTKEIKN